MDWNEIKESIVGDLHSRGLKDTEIRLRALNRIENILQLYYASYIRNPEKLNEIDKEVFKRGISVRKGKALSSAEHGVVNEIYERIAPPLLMPVPRKKPLVEGKYKVCICPNCYTPAKVTEDLWDCKELFCPECGNFMPNPIREEKLLESVGRMAVTGILLGNIAKLFCGLFVLFVILYALWGCRGVTETTGCSWRTIAGVCIPVDSVICNDTASCSIPSEKKITLSTEKGNIPREQREKLLGVWADYFNANGEVLWRIVKKEKGLYALEIGRTGTDEWQVSCELIETPKGGYTVYEAVESVTEEYYRIETSGGLSVFDRYGYITTYRKISTR